MAEIADMSTDRYGLWPLVLQQPFVELRIRKRIRPHGVIVIFKNREADIDADRFSIIDRVVSRIQRNDDIVRAVDGPHWQSCEAIEEHTDQPTAQTGGNGGT